MKYALVIVQSDKVESVAVQAMVNLSNNPESGGRNIKPEDKLNIGAYLLPLGNGLQALSDLIADAHSRGLDTQTLFFDQEPPFVVTKAK